jgi:protoporphyrinogen oxidase
VQEHEVVILGGGLTGLSAAHRLQQAGLDYCLVEAEERVGGLCRSAEVEGFTFDQTGHLLHFADPVTEEFVRDLVPEPLVEHERRAWIYTDGCYSRYPFQRNLFGLPEPVVKECVLEYVEADLAGGSSSQNDFGSWARARFGDGIAEHFLLPYNRKLWLTEPTGLTLDWMGRFVPDTSPVDIIRGAFSADTEEVGYNASFLYPQRSGIEVLPRSLAARLDKVRCGLKVVRVDAKERVVHTDSGSSYRYRHLVSTIPLPVLLSCVDSLPGTIRELASKLIHTSVLDVNLGLDVEELTDKHWIYVPDPDIPFYRIGFPCNFSSHLAPPGKQSVYAEISHRGAKELDEDELVNGVVSGMKGMGFAVRTSDVLAVNIVDMDYGYVVYDFDRSECLREIKQFLSANGMKSVGRFGSWAYLSMEDSIREGISAAEDLLR